MNSRFYPDRGSWSIPLQPEYPYAHCINSGAEKAVLEAEFETGAESTNHDQPDSARRDAKWPNIEAYAEKVSVARTGLAKLLEARSIFAFVG